jgi:hypothetical protein
MRAIHKYIITGMEPIAMPKGARVLHIDGQDGSICAWALVDTEQLAELRHFTVYGTGHELPDDFREENLRMGEDGTRYLGTALCDEFVWHVFERWA